MRLDDKKTKIIPNQDIQWRSEINCRVIDSCIKGEVAEMSEELAGQFVESGKAEYLKSKHADKEIKAIDPELEKAVEDIPKPRKKRSVKKASK